MRKFVAGVGVAAAITFGVSCSGGGSSYASCLDATNVYLDDLLATQSYADLEGVADEYGFSLADDNEKKQDVRQILPECRDITADEEKRLGEEIEEKATRAVGHLFDVMLEDTFSGWGGE
jgi:methyl coenzyme M reductase alpha subunit